jgi:tetraacyldisaccharide 4'-kinase
MDVGTLNQIVAWHYTPSPPWVWVELTAVLRWGYTLAWWVRQLALQWGWLSCVTLPCPVVSVGNITTGGTGKTPVVKALAKHWLAQGKRVVILSRGYGATAPQRYAQATHPAFGDEAHELQQALPQAVVIVGRNRCLTAQQAYQAYQPDVVLLDDGYQYQRLSRQANLLLVDVRPHRGVGNGYVLPTGPNREPLSHALRRATHVLAAHASSVVQGEEAKSSLPPSVAQGLTHLSPNAFASVTFAPTGWLALATGKTLPLQALAGWAALLVSGLAQGDAFEAAVASEGVTVLGHHRLADHAQYTPEVCRQVAQHYQSHQAHHPQLLVITTAKDASKWLVEDWPKAVWQHSHVLQWEAMLPTAWLAELDASLWPNDLTP